MAIDVHSHWYPEALIEALKAHIEFPVVKPGDDGTRTLFYEGADALPDRAIPISGTT